MLTNSAAPLTSVWPYVLVALGGALGSVARYAISLVTAASWGEAFPWGTILINVAGSFVIGYVAALTLADGPAPASTDVRLFVLVGVCGGFTTFSSFSLQTLSLLRGGNWLGASLNAAASVALCILAVGLGHALAQRSGPLFHKEAATMQTILAVLNRPETARPVLAVAGMLSASSDGQITVLHIRHDPMEGFMPTEEVMTDKRLRQIKDESAGRASDLRVIFDDWHRTLDPSRSAAWRETIGTTKATIATEGNKSGLIVLGDAPARNYGYAKQAIQSALLDTETPVVIVPEGPVPESVGRNIAIAWKPSEAADKAIEAALPILLKAERVAILIAMENGDRDDPPSDLLDRLGKRGIAAQIDRFPLGQESIGDALCRKARAHGADLLVMGAFTHNHIMEAILGGATREILADAEIPVLMHG
jgi:CrcB protein